MIKTGQIDHIEETKDRIKFVTKENFVKSATKSLLMPKGKDTCFKFWNWNKFVNLVLKLQTHLESFRKETK